MSGIQQLHPSTTRLRKACLITLLASLGSLASCGGGAGSSGAGGSNAGSGGGVPGTGALVYGNLNGAATGIGASLNGAVPFPADNAWNTDISNAAVDDNSDNLIASIGMNTTLHPDFGAGLYAGAPIGIPYVVVDSSQAKVPIDFGAYIDQSDLGPYPIPADAPIEGGPAAGPTDDRHVLVVDKSANLLYEMGNSFPPVGAGNWTASGGAKFNLTSNALRPAGWTSADAAGLPIFPGLARYDEVAAGAINHALRFTVSATRKAYVPPATHWASVSTDVNRPPMGMRVRLKASYAIPSAFNAQTKIILTALKKYGMFVADNGSNWYITGAPNAGWHAAVLTDLGQVAGSNFEVVKMENVVTPP